MAQQLPKGEFPPSFMFSSNGATVREGEPLERNPLL
jgi:hypothetical protein